MLSLSNREAAGGFSGWGLFWTMLGCAVVILPGGLGVAALVASLFGHGETHGLNVYSMVFWVIGVPSLVVGATLLRVGTRMIRNARPGRPSTEPADHL